MTEDDGALVVELEDGVSYEEHRESMSPKQGTRPSAHPQPFAQALRIPLHSLDFSMANEDLFRRSLRADGPPRAQPITATL